MTGRRRLLCLAVLALLAGCASRPVHVRTLPPDRPAARNTPAAPPSVTPTENAAVEPDDAPSMQTYDPWERINRVTYRFNARVDENVLLPVADHYRRLPAPLRTGVHNFFSNVGEIGNIAYYALQGRPRRLLRSVGRLVINSTVGVFGLVDVAAHMHLTGRPTGLSATLSGWGMHPGPYLVIPLLGPSTLRDGIGLLGDFTTSYVANPLGFYQGTGSWYVEGVNVIDKRASTDFRYFSTGSPFDYDNVRFLYVRARLIEDGSLPAHSSRPVAEPGVPAGK